MTQITEKQWHYIAVESGKVVGFMILEPTEWMLKTIMNKAIQALAVWYGMISNYFAYSCLLASKL